MKKEKIYFIDNLRVLLITLVVLHHSFITYGAPGGWYYKEPTTHVGALLAMTVFVSINQSFFMGFFFFLSALFIEPSIYRKGKKQFIFDRLKRLGIPLVFYSLVISPVLNWFVERFGYDKMVSFRQYLGGYHHWVDFGVLWFVAALLTFTLIYVLISPLVKANPKIKRSVPRNSIILLFAFLLGVLSWIVRIFFPLGWVLYPVGFQLAHFSQYIFMFILGIIAARNQWLDQFDIKRARIFLRIIGIMNCIFFPLMYIVKAVTGSSMEAFEGRGTYLSFLSAVWEQIMGISMMVVLLGVGNKKWNRQSILLKKMSRSAYAVYIFHPLVIVSLSLFFRGFVMDPSLKLVFVAPLAVIFSFLLGSLLVRIPGVRNII